MHPAPGLCHARSRTAGLTKHRKFIPRPRTAMPPAELSRAYTAQQERRTSGHDHACSRCRISGLAPRCLGQEPRRSAGAVHRPGRGRRALRQSSVRARLPSAGDVAQDQARGGSAADYSSPVRAEAERLMRERLRARSPPYEEVVRVHPDGRPSEPDPGLACPESFGRNNRRLHQPP